MGNQFHDLCYTDDPLAAPEEPGVSLVSALRPDIQSWVQLAAIATVGAALPVIIEWYDPTVGLIRSVLAQVGTDATDTSIGVQRADDWATSGVVWYQLGNAG